MYSKFFVCTRVLRTGSLCSRRLMLFTLTWRLLFDVVNLGDSSSNPGFKLAITTSRLQARHSPSSRVGNLKSRGEAPIVRSGRSKPPRQHSSRPRQNPTHPHSPHKTKSLKPQKSYNRFTLPAYPILSHPPALCGSGEREGKEKHYGNQQLIAHQRVGGRNVSVNKPTKGPPQPPS